MTVESDIARVAAWLGQAKRVLCITGAGISADSGLPTYRGIGGLYDREITEEGFPIELALSGDMFRSRPSVTWRYIREIEAACRGATFNRAHEVIAALDQPPRETWVLTQNVDGFHRQAGSRHLIDIHGDVHELSCPECEYREHIDDYADLPAVPRCPSCMGTLRPDVVLFGEILPQHKVLELTTQLGRGFDVILSIGTTSIFPYIAGPVIEAQRQGIPTVEVNPGETEVSHLVDVKLTMRAAAACDAIWKALAPRG